MLERKKLKFRNHGIPESRSFLVRYRRTYVLKNRVLFESLKDCKRRNIGHFMLKSNSNKIMLCGGEGQHYMFLNKI